MDYYYTSTPNVSSRGRFSSRGGSSYRGAGRGESYRGSRGGGSYTSPRGYSSSRGRGSYYPKYENTSSKYSSDGARYGSQNRVEDNYRKSDTSPYGSTRDHSHHRSDIDIARKRIRSDSYSQSQGTPGGRRSHEMDEYRGSGSRFSNSNSYSDSRSFSENRGIFKKPRISDYKPKEDYRSRKDIPRSSIAISKLRSLRGRSIRGRAILRRGGDSFLARKRAAFSSSRTSDLIALRRAKLLRTRRLRERARQRIAEEKAAEDEKGSKSGDEKDNENDEKKDEENQENGEQNTDETKDRGKEKDKEEEGEICDGENESKDKDKTKSGDEKFEGRFDVFRKPFMKLQCPQCSVKCITFKEYIQHLYQPTHVKAMKEKSDQVRQTLVKMRLAQRAKQKEVDEEDLTNMNTRSIFCPICKLNYSQEKSVHQSSEAHKKLKNFLHPYCRICRISYKNPMIYERHICSLEHMRKKNSLDQRLGKTKGTSLEYLDNFMVLDSVGSGDEPEDGKDEKTEDEKKQEKTEKISDDDLNLGIEFIRKVEAFYCELCRTYLPRITNEERVLKVHCRTKYHLKCYSKFGSNEFLAQVESRKKKGEAEKEEKSGAKDKEGEGKENANHDEGGEDEVGIDDKLWADVSDLLNQVQPEAKSDDEEEEEGGRFDRFKSNEKKENGEVGSSEEGIEGKEKCDGAPEEIKVEVQETA